MSDYIDFIDSNGNEWTRTTRFREARETIAAQAAVIAALRAHLKVIAGLQLCADNLMSNSDIAAKALALSTDSTQILDEVRRAERERCAKVCEGLKKKGIDYFMADSFAAAIRAME